MLLGTLGSLSAAAFKYGHGWRGNPHLGLADVFLWQVISEFVALVSIGERSGYHLSGRAAVPWLAPCRMQNVKGDVSHFSSEQSKTQGIEGLGRHFRTCPPHIRTRAWYQQKGRSENGSGMNYTERGNTISGGLSAFNPFKGPKDGRRNHNILLHVMTPLLTKEKAASYN